MIRVSPDAESEVLKDGRILTREKARAVKRMSVDELNAWAVSIYGSGFRNGVDAVQDALEEQADVEAEDDVTEVSVGWEEVLEVIGKVRGIGPKTLAEIDKALKEKY
jgi:hypothetical protein